jgi:dUTP pyrophosphatase
VLEIQIHRLPHGQDLPWPELASKGSAGFDLRAAVAEPLELAVGERVLAPTGLQIAIPLGWEAQVRPRSGLALKHGIILPNSPGTIDSDYRGEVGVILANIGQTSFTFQPGDRIAQLVFARVETVRWLEVEQLPASELPKRGFGSTGMT